MRLILKLGLLLCLPIPALSQATYNASSCNESAIQAAYATEQASKADGDIIVVPSCPSGTAWTSSWAISPTNSLTFRGQTTIAGTCAPGGSCTTTDSTVLIDNTPHSSDGDTPMIGVTLKAGKLFRMSGFTLETNGSSQESYNSGGLTLSGNSTGVRVDHMDMNMPLHATQMGVFGCVYGVFDHSIMNLSVGTTNNGIRLYQGSCNGDSAGVGNGQWNNATALGSANYFYIENSVFNGGTTGSSSIIPFTNDCLVGGRFVVRFSTLNGTETQEHATGAVQNPPWRGCRAFEFYENSLSDGGSMNSSNPAQPALFLTSGTGVIWGNNVPGHYYSLVSGLVDLAGPQSNYAQVSPPTGWGYCSTSSQNGVAGPSNWDGNLLGQNGYPCVDEIGRGAGDMLSGSFPTLCDVTSGGCKAGTNTGTWPNQLLEPVYEWLDQWVAPPDTGNGFWAQQNQPASNRDYYLYTLSWNGSAFTGPAFNGTVGTGSGTLASRPSTCSAGPGGAFGGGITGTPGVAYWATDQGNWNMSGSGGQGDLYVCTATNTWTLYYTPYTYPHPLATPNPPPSPSATVVVN
jgi:hypothetical protein